MMEVNLTSSGVLDVCFDHPPVNAFSIGLLDELAALLRGVDSRPEVHVVLV